MAAPTHRVRRIPERGHYDAQTVHRILDASPFCHVGLVEDGTPVVIPTLFARVEDTILLHGATASRRMRHAGSGATLSIAVTVLDGLVLARSVFHHSANYRSVVLFGRGRLVEEDGEKLAALQRLTEKLVPGRWADARGPNSKELRATAVVEVAIEAASAKIRTGPPGDEPEDMDLPVWAGVMPFLPHWGVPEPDQTTSELGLAFPEYLSRAAQ